MTNTQDKTQDKAQDKTKHETLVVVFDGAGARYFRRSEKGKLTLQTETRSGLHDFTRDVTDDQQGRTYSSTGSGVRHAYEPRHDPHKQEKHDFVHKIAADLDAAYEQHTFSDLMIVAPARSLGEFRALASDKLKALTWREVPKEFSQYSQHELESRLQPYFES